MIKYNKYLIVMICLIANVLSAQNFLYNTEQFGIRGSMLGGVVTAGTDDISTIYYNPAAIHKVAPGIDISLVQPEIKTFGLKQFWNDGEQSSLNRRVGLKPSLISFKTNLKNLELAFIKIGKSNGHDQLNIKRESTNNSIQSIQNFEYEFGGSDNWYGVGTSFELKPTLHFGISQFVSVAKFSYRNDILVETTDLNFNPSQPSQYFKSSLNSTYNNIGLISKVGLLYDTENHDIGLTITTPTFLRLSRGGDFNQARVDINLGSINIEGIIDSELSPEIKTPWEFNLGYSLALNSERKLWINASYHTQIADYVMTEIQSTNDRAEWINGNQSVFNFGVGYSDQINSFLELSGGVRTNNFGYENKTAAEGTIRNVILDGNHMHFVLSSKFLYKRNTILLGFDWGTLVNMPEEDNSSRLVNIDVLAPNDQDLTKSSVSILFTYGFIIDTIKK